MPRIILLLLTLTLTSLCAAAPAVTVKLQEMTHHKSDVAPHVGHDCVRQFASLDTEAITYALQYCSP